VAVTGADGIAKVKLTSPRRTWEPLVAFATTEAGGFGVASTSWQDGISPWDFGTQGAAEADPYIGYVYTDRPIYRPDQTVYWKGSSAATTMRSSPCPRPASRSP